MRDLIQNKSWKHMKLNRSTNHALPAQGYDQIINSSIFNKYYGKIGQKAKKIKMQKLLFGNRMKIMTDSL